MKADYTGGPNLAMKVPPHAFDATVGFYRDTLGLAEIDELKPDIVFEFGANRLWIDRVPDIDRAEIWLQVQTADGDQADGHLATHLSDRGGQLDPLPEGFAGFWIANPAGVIHLVSDRSDP